ncbi:actin nucleation-promoting factor WAS-like isoform X3 [Adelges cooleyi]|uniref:actin nucleation-promoting factor WAS-like isoform X3 n=1 Tax=Adelges cooleyi TaxID=133065 RepID=UPI00217FA7BC|nr:actin nucleation-promoting factor WAS-like isoform X3 [Adelges cooleyi]
MNFKIIILIATSVFFIVMATYTGVDAGDPEEKIPPSVSRDGLPPLHTGPPAQRNPKPPKLPTPPSGRGPSPTVPQAPIQPKKP